MSEVSNEISKSRSFSSWVMNVMYFCVDCLVVLFLVALDGLYLCVCWCVNLSVSVRCVRSVLLWL